MNRYSLNTLILLGVISIAGIMVIQGVWVRKTMELQVKNIAIQEKEDSLNLKEFSEQSHVAYIQVKDLSDNLTNQVFVFNGWTFSSSTTVILLIIQFMIYGLSVVRMFR